MIELSPEIQQLLQKRVLCFFATIMPDGSPQMTQTWVDTDGSYILINTVEGHQKHRNVRRDPRVTLAVVDPGQGERARTIRGRVVEITTEGDISTSRNSPSATLDRKSIVTGDLARCVFY